MAENKTLARTDFGQELWDLGMLGAQANADVLRIHDSEFIGPEPDAAPRCADCGRTADQGRLKIHHHHFNTAIDNLRLLCVTCRHRRQLHLLPPVAATHRSGEPMVEGNHPALSGGFWKSVAPYPAEDPDALSREEIIRHLAFLLEEKVTCGRKLALRQAKALDAAIRLIGGGR